MKEKEEDMNMKKKKCDPRLLISYRFFSSTIVMGDVPTKHHSIDSKERLQENNEDIVSSSIIRPII